MQHLSYVPNISIFAECKQALTCSTEFYLTGAFGGEQIDSTMSLSPAGEYVQPLLVYLYYTLYCVSAAAVEILIFNVIHFIYHCSCFSRLASQAWVQRAVSG